MNSCHNSKTDKDSEKEEIVEIQWWGYGGDAFYSETITVNKDSVKYYYYWAFDDAPSEYEEPIKEEDWINIIDSFELEDFKKVKNGQSLQIIDGTDQEIQIMTEKDTLSVINPSQDEVNYPKIQKLEELLLEFRPQ